ncbi:hypothetical protein NDU88_006795 [Pleurodeles waltl]|uniref:Uncharacterized protein n=1 Tax=Pleurodeles waltl TaxID=8319 RepID=A0AAV7VMX2_PLEWA|nr:hypothetical protein NDU88_006795 [Pleurodeles waltl]
MQEKSRFKLTTPKGIPGESTYVPVPDRSDVEWRVGPVFKLARYECEARLKSRCSDRVPSLGRDREHLEDAPRGARCASLDPRDSGKLSPVVYIHRVQR